MRAAGFGLARGLLRARRMSMRTRACLLFASLGLGAGCAVQYPQAWSQRAAAAEVVSATRGKMYGWAPLSWDLPGDRVRVEVRRAKVSTGPGLYQEDFDFSLSYASAPGHTITCATDPSGSDGPRTRFGCWSEAEAIRCWMAPDADCRAEGFAAVRTLTSPACWRGEVSLDGRRIQLEHGHLRSMGAPVGYVTWVDESGALLLAADIVGSMRTALFDPRPVAADELRRRLVLLTLALSWWEHAARS